MKGGARKGAGRPALVKGERRGVVSICVDERTKQELRLLRQSGLNISEEFRGWTHQLCTDLELNDGGFAD